MSAHGRHSPLRLHLPVLLIQLYDFQLLACEKLRGENEQKLIQEVENQGLHIMPFGFKGPALGHDAAVVWQCEALLLACQAAVRCRGSSCQVLIPV